MPPEQRIKSRKQNENIDIQALSAIGYMLNYDMDARTGAAYCREINEELAELHRSYPKHLRGVAMLPWQDTNAALKEMEYAVKDLGLRAITVATNINGRNLDDPKLLPVFEAIVAEGLLVSCHPTYWAVEQERLSRYAFRGTIGVPVETTIAIMSLIFGGVPCGHRPWTERQARDRFYRILRDEIA